MVQIPDCKPSSVILKLSAIFKSDDLSSKVKRSTLYSSIIKGCSILISLLLVPVTLGFLNPLEYGIWLTLSSVLVWIHYFDIGLGNGLRNKLGEAIANNDMVLGQKYVSTTFYILMLIVLLIFSAFLILQHWLDWSAILNAKETLSSSFSSLVIVVFAFFCLSFLFKFIGNIFLADQKSHINDLLGVLGSFLSLVAIFCLKYFTIGSLYLVAIIFSASPVIVYIVAFPIVFYWQYPHLRPKLSMIDFSHFKDLFGLGIQFFFLQIGGMLIFTTSNIIISQSLGPELVTPYNISFKYFGIVTMLFAIIVSPIWSGTTSSYARGDMQWIDKARRGSLKIWLFTSGLAIFFLLISPYVFTFWVGKYIEIPFLLSGILTLYVILTSFSQVYSTFLFGMGKIRLQLYNTIIAGLIFIPLAVFLGRLLGIYGIVFALILVNLSGAILNYYQFNRIVENNAIGVWNK